MRESGADCVDEERSEYEGMCFPNLLIPGTLLFLPLDVYIAHQCVIKELFKPRLSPFHRRDNIYISIID